MTDAPHFRINFAPHLGFPVPDTPLFGALVGDVSPLAQMDFAASQGFRWVQDPFSAQRSVAAQSMIGDRARDRDLRLGCFVYAPMARAMQPAWGTLDPEGRRILDTDIAAAIAIGKRIGSRHIAVVTGAATARPKAEQRCAMATNLARVADRVMEAGMVLCVEAVSAQRLPLMLLHHLDEAVEVVRGAAHPAVRLIFDTGHVQAMDGDILGNMDRAWDLIELIQIADHPGRVEPGAGELNFDRIFDEIAARGFAGPVELEHGWAAPDVDRQQDYLRWLGRWATSKEGTSHGDDAA